MSLDRTICKGTLFKMSRNITKRKNILTCYLLVTVVATVFLVRTLRTPLFDVDMANKVRRSPAVSCPGEKSAFWGKETGPGGSHPGDERVGRGGQVPASDSVYWNEAGIQDLDIVSQSYKSTKLTCFKTDDFDRVRAGVVGGQEDKKRVSGLPEPSLLFLVGTGLVGIAVFLGRREKRR
mgnify:CR=1 FL=1